MIKITTKNSGFSLVEVLVAITILLLVIAGPLSIISRSINSTNYATEQVNAWFLAQEGLELVQKGRDDLVLADFKDQLLGQSLQPDPMTRFLIDYANCLSSNGCGVTIGNGAAAAVSVKDCGANSSGCQLYLNNILTDRARYTHTVGPSKTLFTRVVKIEPSYNTAPTPDRIREMKVTSTVTWRTGSLISSQKVAAVSYLFNVYDSN